MNQYVKRARAWAKPILPPFFRLIIACFQKADRLWGPRCLSCLLVPALVFDGLRSMPDYPYFKRLRETLPATFWRKAPLAHYLHMFRVWNETLVTILLYDRLSSPAWKARMTVSGTPPDQLPEWGQRPVIVTFLHAGAFGILRYWLRSRGIPTASLIRGLPRILLTFGETSRQDGDARYALRDVPHTFIGPNSMRQALGFLRPGRALTLALDGNVSGKLIPCQVNGTILHLKDGVVRFAQKTNAMVLPVSVLRRGPFRFEFRFGLPLPDRLLQSNDTRTALQYLARELWNELEQDPVAMNWSVLEALAPEKVDPRSNWP